MQSPRPGNVTILESIFFVSNVHCSSCVAYITEILSEFSGIESVDVSILTAQVCVAHTTETTPLSLATALIQAAFEVHHVTTKDGTGLTVADIDTTSSLPRDSMLFTPQQNTHSNGVPQDRHLANCDACRKEELKRDSVTGSSTKFKARISIGGMSCASCVNTITNELNQLDFVEEVVVNLLTNSATVVYNGPQKNSERVVDQIEDIGFEAALDEVEKLNGPPTSIKTPAVYTAEIAIGGMTCGSCASAVSRGLEELPFVKEVSVNLLSHNGKVEFEGQSNINLIVEKIEDLGYDASISSVHAQAPSPNENEVEERTVSICVDGMFCHHCPEKVLGSLKDIPDVQVDDALSVKNPILRVTYMPSSSLTIRSIIDVLNKTHDAFSASVYHPPSIEDRSRAMQLHERRRLLSRLLFVFIVAIPTFLIGIVFMSLVSSDNHVRKYLEGSIWAGNVSRIEWALFIMTTPVMFYGTDIFHVRAAKEVYSLWRPGSRVPILRRFYRFGSMNLLISAGTTVAYISSLAVLIIDAVVTTPSNTHSMTYFDSVVFLTLFILAGRFIEAYSKAKTGDAVASLGKLKPSDALLVVGSDSQGDDIQRTGLDLLEIGDLVSIPHGSSPPADGTIVDNGTYQFDESSLTGESKPVKKSIGDSVYTGSVNVGQPVKIKVTALGSASMLDQIISVVREGQSRRAPLERVADMLTSHFVPIITLIAISTFVIWLSLGTSGTLPGDYLDVAHGGWVFWSLEFAIAVFVVACPCGLALAAPTALFVGGGLAARQGILVKGGGEAFQEASNLDAIVFDKTGTLTEGGSLAVSDHEVLLTDAEDLQVAWALARKLEESSTHPIARAISNFCHQRSSVPIIGSDIEEKSGLGMRGTFTVQTDNATMVKYEAAIGNQRLLQSMNSLKSNDDHLNNLLSKYQTSGKSTAIFSLRRISDSSISTTAEPITTAIIFGISDTIRPHTVQVISKLQKRKINVFMCTGDNQTTAHAVADMIGIPRSNVQANVTPAGKGDFVRQVQDRIVLSGPPRSDSEAESQQQTKDKNKSARSIVAFVGDGVNDSPALAAADVSIAMASGSDVAMNSASFILLNSELDTILQLVVLSRRVFNRVKMNFCWAVVYNLSLVPIAAGVLYPIVNGHKMHMNPDGGSVMVNTHWRLSPVWAALAMALSSISVVLSSLALGIEWRRIRKWVGLGRGSE
ncbi:copper resistance-associated P-type ATPase [Aspergillus steynii IBT 23096]|uniref:Copper resistance-associated P-type ATPase n=1 Tax=Aspergillus steynii IBT 23096 TaxID=1392250 RepID=A0A2I2GJQ0_9EURO|nr:copper resistance-associated P-type ATPase [Aspergillus steynii IBT 23096]PLB53108.1 copper resistance-associated P-type ATPase [Aspergillus steynii IBT 23096]